MSTKEDLGPRSVAERERLIQITAKAITLRVQAARSELGEE